MISNGVTIMLPTALEVSTRSTMDAILLFSGSVTFCDTAD